MNKHLRTIRTTLCALALALPLAATAHAQYARVGPPPPVVESPGPVPYRGAVWVPGHHRWTGRGYVWVPGHYVRARRAGAVWVPGHWQQTPRGWVYRAGHWRY